MAVFAVSQTLFYMTMPLVMKVSSAAVVNLSLLTADIFTLVFGVFLFKFKVSRCCLQTTFLKFMCVHFLYYASILLIYLSISYSSHCYTSYPLL